VEDVDDILATIPVAEYRKTWGISKSPGELIGARSVIFTSSGVFVLNLGYKTTVTLRGQTTPTEVDVNDSQYAAFTVAANIGKQQVISDSKQKIDSIKDKSKEYILGLNRDNFYWSYNDIDRILPSSIGMFGFRILSIWPQKDNHRHVFQYNDKEVKLDDLLNFLKTSKQYGIRTNELPKANLLIKMILAIVLIIILVIIISLTFSPHP
jgi:hypothetical protein